TKSALRAQVVHSRADGSRERAGNVGTTQSGVVDVVDARRGRQVTAMRVCAVLIAVVFLGGVAGLAVASPAHQRTPAQQLAQVRHFVTSERTAHFTGTSTWKSGTPAGQVGDHYEHTSRALGVLALPDRSHWTEDMGDAAYETIVGPEGVFERDADTMAGLAREQWKQYPNEPNEPQQVPATPPPTPAPDSSSGADSGGGIMITEAGGALSALGAPAEFTQALDHMTGLTRVNDHVIRGTLDLSSLHMPADAGPPPNVTIEIASDTNGRLEQIVADMSGTTPAESYSAHTEMRFTQWGSPVDVTVPNADNVDKTPDVDEDSLAAFTAAPILVPGNLPSGYELTSGSTTDAGDGSDCAEADLTYGDPSQAASSPDAPDATDINITITPSSCDTSPAEGDPVTVGGHPARISHGD